MSFKAAITYNKTQPCQPLQPTFATQEEAMNYALHVADHSSLIADYTTVEVANPVTNIFKLKLSLVPLCG